MVKHIYGWTSIFQSPCYWIQFISKLSWWYYWLKSSDNCSYYLQFWRQYVWTIDVIRLKSFSQLQLATVSGLVVGSIASGVYGVGASMRVDLEYTELVSSGPNCYWGILSCYINEGGVYWIGTHRRTPFYVILALLLVMGIPQTEVKIHSYARWASPRTTISTYLKYLKLISMACCHLFLTGFGNFLPMPVGHLFKRSL